MDANGERWCYYYTQDISSICPPPCSCLHAAEFWWVVQKCSDTAVKDSMRLSLLYQILNLTPPSLPSAYPLLLLITGPRPPPPQSCSLILCAREVSCQPNCAATNPLQCTLSPHRRRERRGGSAGESPPPASPLSCASALTSYAALFITACTITNLTFALIRFLAFICSFDFIFVSSLHIWSW